MAMGVIRQKESFRVIQLRPSSFIAFKLWTYQFVTHVENLLKIDTPLNVIYVWQKYI